MDDALEDERAKKFKFGTPKNVLTDEVVKTIDAPLTKDIQHEMLNGSIDAGDAKRGCCSIRISSSD